MNNFADGAVCKECSVSENYNHRPTLITKDGYWKLADFGSVASAVVCMDISPLNSLSSLTEFTAQRYPTAFNYRLYFESMLWKDSSHYCAERYMELAIIPNRALQEKVRFT